MTDTDLVRALAADLKPAEPSAGAFRLGWGVALGALPSAALTAAVLGPAPGLLGAGAPALVMKLAYVAPLAALAFAATLRMGRPGAETPSLLPMLLPVAVLGVLAAAALTAQPAAAAKAQLFGSSWRACAVRIALLALPVFAGAILALRRQAPTRLRLAGACAGLLAGATAAAVYAFACAERSPAFVVVWYSAGIGAATSLGALLGPRLLRW